MAESLRRLTQTASFRVLQDKLESWHRDYRVSFSAKLNSDLSSLRWFRLITTANTNVSLRLFFITNYCLLMASFCLPWLFIVSPTQVRLKWMTCFKIIQHKNRRDLKFLLWQVQFGSHGCWLSWLRSENSKDVLIPFLTLLVEIRSKKTRPILWNYSEIVNVWHLMTVNDLTLTCRGMEDYCSPLSFIQEKIKPNKMKKKAS